MEKMTREGQTKLTYSHCKLHKGTIVIVRADETNMDIQSVLTQSHQNPSDAIVYCLQSQTKLRIVAHPESIEIEVMGTGVHTVTKRVQTVKKGCVLTLARDQDQTILVESRQLETGNTEETQKVRLSEILTIYSDEDVETMKTVYSDEDEES